MNTARAAKPAALTRARRERVGAAIVAVTLAAVEELAAVAACLPAAADDRLAAAGDALADAVRELLAAWPPSAGAPGIVDSTLTGTVSGLLQVDGQVYPFGDPAAGRPETVIEVDARGITVYGQGAAVMAGGHDVPHWANGPEFGAPPPVNAICICTCAGCCGHCPGIAPALGVPGRCPACTCYLMSSPVA